MSKRRERLGEGNDTERDDTRKRRKSDKQPTSKSVQGGKEESHAVSGSDRWAAARQEGYLLMATCADTSPPALEAAVAKADDKGSSVIWLFHVKKSSKHLIKLALC